jgi:hypothetical protein
MTQAENIPTDVEDINPDAEGDTDAEGDADAEGDTDAEGEVDYEVEGEYEDSCIQGGPGT